ncbi:MAG: hypothetical protein L6R36_000233 [Xanthoria steineri]|nr:MAG: hypothetical protein L6R36_000233 [Xanthoria steineri]
MNNNLKSRRRSDYPYQLDYRTRWSDNDMYHHINNSIYNFLFDSIINTYLITHCSLHPPTSPQIFLAVSTSCSYFAPISFPAVIDLGLRVTRLGKASVRYEVGVFERGAEDVRAVGGFVHVFVERGSGETVRGGIEGDQRSGLERILVREGGEGTGKAKL